MGLHGLRSFYFLAKFLLVILHFCFLFVKQFMCNATRTFLFETEPFHFLYLNNLGMFAPNEADFEFSVLVVTVKLSIFWFTAVPQISLQTKVVTMEINIPAQYEYWV